MRHLFIIDENVIAQTRAPFLAKETFDFFMALYENCHQIALSPELSGKLRDGLTGGQRNLGGIFRPGRNWLCIR